MKLKEALIACLMPDDSRSVCDEFKLDANRRSADRDGDGSRQREGSQARAIDQEVGLVELADLHSSCSTSSTEGDKLALVERLLAAGSRAPHCRWGECGVFADDGNVAAYLRHSPPPRTRTVKTGDDTAQYRHNDEAVQRPDAGVQDQFQAKKPARTYRYDSSSIQRCRGTSSESARAGGMAARADRACDEGRRASGVRRRPGLEGRRRPYRVDR